MITHAPGPWAIIPRLSPEGDIATVYGTTEGWVSIYAPGWSNIGDRKVAMANARLIASAPDLLEALNEARKKLAWFVESYPHDLAVPESEFFKVIDTAIAKAKGDA